MKKKISFYKGTDGNYIPNDHKTFELVEQMENDGVFEFEVDVPEVVERFENVYLDKVTNCRHPTLVKAQTYGGKNALSVVKHTFVDGKHTATEIVHRYEEIE